MGRRRNLSTNRICAAWHGKKSFWGPANASQKQSSQPLKRFKFVH